MATKLDRLFRENLDQIEMTPSEQGWDQVKDQLAKKKKGILSPLLKVAAAVVILLSATITIIRFSETGHDVSIIATNDYPQVNQWMKWSVEVPEKPEVPVQTETSTKAAVTPSNVTRQEDQDDNVNELSIYRVQSFTIASIGQASINAELDPSIPKSLGKPAMEEEVSQVKIMYIASNKNNVSGSDSTKTSKINKVFAMAKDVSTTDILADLRDVKDNLFSRN